MNVIKRESGAPALLAAGAAAFVMTTATGNIALAGEQSAIASQQAQGQRLYERRCAICHGGDLGGGSAPALRGKTLFTKKKQASAADFATWTRINMPENAPGILSPEDSLALTAYILRLNTIFRDAEPLTAARAASVKLEENGR